MKIKNFAVVMTSVVGAVFGLSGIFMVFKGLTATGSIDIRTSLISGRIETGSVGLLFAFLGVILLVTSVLVRRRERASFKLKSGRDEIDWSHSQSGDSFLELMTEVFREELPYRQPSDLPLIDELVSENTIRVMVDTYLQDKLNKQTFSFLEYHLPKRLERRWKIIGDALEVVNEGLRSDRPPSSEPHDPRNLPETQVLGDTLSMIESTVCGYFTSKKRIFAGWDKFPVCSPPIHGQVAEWLLGIEKEWQQRMRTIRDSLAIPK